MVSSYKFLIYLGSILSLVGFIIISDNLKHTPFHFNEPHNFGIQIIGFSFWYIEPIIGLILVFVPKKRKIKYFGVFFLIVWICAVIHFIYKYTYG
jgi:hypothetical protein